MVWPGVLRAIRVRSVLVRMVSSVSLSAEAVLEAEEGETQEEDEEVALQTHSSAAPFRCGLRGDSHCPWGQPCFPVHLWYRSGGLHVKSCAAGELLERESTWARVHRGSPSSSKAVSGEQLPYRSWVVRRGLRGNGSEHNLGAFTEKLLGFSLGLQLSLEDPLLDVLPDSLVLVSVQAFGHFNRFT